LIGWSIEISDWVNFGAKNRFMEFEKRIKQSLSENVKSALPTWLEYIEWIQGEIEAGRKTDQDLFKQIEKCCKTLEKQEYYRNDKSYLRLWITYADMTNQEIKVFSQLKEKKIGSSLALFHEAWATVLETNGDIEGANKVLLDGKLSKTSPDNHLSNFYTNFLSRNPQLNKPISSESGVIPGYNKTSVYPNGHDEFSFEELRSRQTRYQKKEDSESDVDVSLNISDSLSISIHSMDKENQVVKPSIRKSLAALLSKPIVAKKDLTIHSKQAEKDILDMFVTPLEDDTLERIVPVVQPPKRIQVFEEHVPVEPPMKKKTVVKQDMIDLRGKRVDLDSDGLLCLGKDQYQVLSESKRGKYNILVAQNESEEICTLKVCRPSHQNEYSVYCQLKETRLGKMMSRFYLLDSESYLVENRMDYGTLMNLIQVYKKNNKLMDEHVAIYYTIELLKQVGVLGEFQIVHGNITPDHIVLLNENADAWDNWTRGDAPGWNAKGILLVDYAQGDLIRKDIQGVCNVVHWMIYGECIELVQKENGLEPKMQPKRFMQTDLWNRLFDSLLNEKESMGDVKRYFEDYLCNNPKKANILKTLLCRQNLFLKENE
jgi:hypothetical protein